MNRRDPIDLIHTRPLIYRLNTHEPLTLIGDIGHRQRDTRDPIDLEHKFQE